MVFDPRGDGQLPAAVNHMVWGSEIQRSRDLGDTWQSADHRPRFEKHKDATVKRIWHIEPGRETEPGAVYAGAEPASLFKSEDGGATWREVVGLTSHPSRESWQPGLGGLCLHSIVLDPDRTERMWAGISAVGIFGTTDGGETWQPMNQGVRADFLPDRYPEYGQCPHKALAHPAASGVLLQQNHCGVFRSDSGGENWTDISAGLPSRFEFVLGLHPQDPETLYVLPEDDVRGDDAGGGMRHVTGASFRVYRSRDGGRSWHLLTEGLPHSNAYLHVMREGMATDTPDPCGVHIGTSAGQVFYSRDEEDTWELLIAHLPPINSVECALLV